MNHSAAAEPVAARGDQADCPATARQLVSEGLGTAFLLATVVGSGIMGERLADGNVALPCSATPSPPAPSWRC